MDTNHLPIDSQIARDAVNFVHSAMDQLQDNDLDIGSKRVISKAIQMLGNSILSGKRTVDECWEFFYELMR